MAKLEANALTSVTWLLSGPDSSTGRYLYLGSGPRLAYWNKNESSPTAHTVLLADPSSLANTYFSGSVKTTSFYMPPGSSTVVVQDTSGKTGIGGLDLGGMSYQIRGRTSDYVFQVIQGTIVPHISYTTTPDADMTIWIYPPVNIFDGVETFGFVPLFLVVGVSYEEYGSSDTMRRDFGVQPYDTPFQWNKGTPYIKLRCRGGVGSKKIHYTQILAR